jgi:hypothetical protein
MNMRKLFPALVLFAVCALPAHAACGALTGGWTCVNNQTGNSGATLVTSQPATAFSSPLTNGSIILVGVVQASSPVTFTISDTAGNSYVDCGKGQIAWNSSGDSGQLFYALNTHTTASDVVTVSSTVNAAFLQINAVELTGNAASTPVDTFAGQAASTSGTGADNITSTSATTATNGDLIFAAENAINGTITAGTGMTLFSGNGETTAAKVQTTAGSVAGTFDDNTSVDPYVCIMVAIKPAAGGGTSGAGVGGKAGLGGKEGFGD